MINRADQLIIITRFEKAQSGLLLFLKVFKKVVGAYTARCVENFAAKTSLACPK